MGNLKKIEVASQNEEISFPIQTDKLAFFMPHKAPMIWVDEVIDFSEKVGHTRVSIDSDSLMLDGKGQVFSGALLEFFAQSYGYLQGAKALSTGRTLKIAYLAAVDRFAIKCQEFPAIGDQLIAELKTLRDMHPLHLIAGTVSDGEGQILCELKIKGFALFSDEGEL